MVRTNDVVARTLREYSDLLTIAGQDRFRARAYERAARSVAGQVKDLGELQTEEIRAIPSVGASIADKIGQILETGSFAELDSLREVIPAEVRRMTGLPGIGPKRALRAHRELGIQTVEELVEAAASGRLGHLRGFSRATELNLLRSVEQLGVLERRVPLHEALEIAELFLDPLRGVAGVREAVCAGSLRRMRETIGDVDLLLTSDRPKEALQVFVDLPFVDRVLARGEKKSSVLSAQGLQVDLRVVSPSQWGAALIYFTGSTAHNVKIRELAQRAGLKLNEYGLFEGESSTPIASLSEEEVYEGLGLPFIEPTLREDRGEVEAGLKGELPSVLVSDQIRGDLHTHTDLTDGTASIQQMLAASSRRGYDYVAVTDHAPDLSFQGMTDRKMLEQRKRLRSLQRRFPGMWLMHGTELNIGPEGEVDWSREFLRGFDITVASVHSHFGQSRAQMTRRLIRAMENPCVNVIGHPTTRKLGRRGPVDLDLGAVFAASARTGTALEINAHPQRLDLGDELVFLARRHGVKFAVSTDAHGVADLEFMELGVACAQRGWLTKDEVINAWPRSSLRRFLRKEPLSGG